MHRLRVRGGVGHASVRLFSSLVSLLLLLACTLPLLVSGQRLFFSGYMHSGLNRILQVYNPSCDAVSLNEFHVRIAPYSISASGALWGQALAFTTGTTLGPRSSTSMCRTYTYGCEHNRTTLTFGGDAAVGLFHNDVLIDIVGSTQGMCSNCHGNTASRGAPWRVANTNAATRFHTLQRKSHVSEGSIDFFYPRGKYVGHVHSSEWIVTSAPTTNILPFNAFVCNDCVCPSALFKATCGTVGTTLGLATVDGATTQIDCPLDCLTRTAPLPVSVANLLVVPAIVGGNNQRYARTSPVCLAAIHAGVLAVNRAAFPSTTFDPQPVALCMWGGSSSVPQYGGGDPTLFPPGGGLSNRHNGRPHLLYTARGNQAYTGSTATCLSSVVGASAPGFSVQLLPVTTCPDDCGGRQKGYCNQNTGRCMCNPPWYGAYCAFRPCAFDCSSPHGTCSSTGVCTCLTGYTGERCTKRTCLVGLETVACNNRGVCNSDTGACMCHAPYFGAKCELSRCPNDCSSSGTCNYSTGICTCNSRRFGEDCSLHECVDGCSGFGTCDHTTGQCICDESAGKDVPTQCLFGNCPSANAQACSGHGVCKHTTRQCVCNTGWRGLDCNTQVGY